jgi:hypothetical protein
VLLTSPEPSAARPAEIAARLLALDPASADLQHMAASLQQSESASDLREIAARVLNELIDRERRRQPGALRPVSPRAFLRSAWAEQWLERGVRP